MRETRLLRTTLGLERQSQSEVKADRHAFAQALQAERDADEAHLEARERLDEAYTAWPGAVARRLDPEALQRFSAWIGGEETRVRDTSARVDHAVQEAQTAAERLAFSKARSDILAKRARSLRRKLAKRRDERQLAVLEIIYAYRAVRS